MKNRQLPPLRIAILIDGGFFIKRFNALYNRDRKMTGEQVADMMYTMALRHVRDNDVLYRIFYYDCEPLDKRMHNPITGRCINYAKSDQYKFRHDLMNALKYKRKVALRIGTLKTSNHWIINPSATERLLKKEISIDDLKEDDVTPEIRQKGIDMKIGVDIASLSLKRFVDKIVLFSGDSDFVPAAKMARREGIDFILNHMKANVEPQLNEHVDGMETFDPYPKKSARKTATKKSATRTSIAKPKTKAAAKSISKTTTKK